MAHTKKNEEFQTTIFYIIRHGETDWNVEKRKQGQKDILLNNTGKSQAIKLAENLNHIFFDVGFSSDLQRAFETACIVANKRIPTIQQDKRLRERCFGQWEGRLWSEFSNAPLAERKDVESDEAIVQRVFAFLHETQEKYKGQTVLIVTHGDVVRNIVASVLKLKCDLCDIQTANTSYLKLSYVNGNWSIQELQGIELPPEQHLVNEKQLAHSLI